MKFVSLNVLKSLKIVLDYYFDYSLKNANSELQKKIDTLNSNITSLNTKIDTLNSNIDDINKTITSLNTKIDNYNTVTSTYNSKCYKAEIFINYANTKGIYQVFDGYDTRETGSKTGSLYFSTTDYTNNKDKTSVDALDCNYNSGYRVSMAFNYYGK